jgi:hypothetical protein
VDCASSWIFPFMSAITASSAGTTRSAAFSGCFAACHDGVRLGDLDVRRAPS